MPYIKKQGLFPVDATAFDPNGKASNRQYDNQQPDDIDHPNTYLAKKSAAVKIEDYCLEGYAWPATLLLQILHEGSR